MLYYYYYYYYSTHCTVTPIPLPLEWPRLSWVVVYCQGTCLSVHRRDNNVGFMLSPVFRIVLLALGEIPEVTCRAGPNRNQVWILQKIICGAHQTMKGNPS